MAHSKDSKHAEATHAEAIHAEDVAHRSMQGLHDADLKVWLAPKQLLVDDWREVHIQDDSIVDGKAQHTAHQLIFTLQFDGKMTEPEGASCLLVPKHAEVLQSDTVSRNDHTSVEDRQQSLSTVEQGGGTRRCKRLGDADTC